MGIPTSHFHCLDWWESADIQVNLAPSVMASVRLTCTPCQHMSARTLFDRMHTLWSSWAVEDTTLASSTKSKVWFAGDTGYRTIRSGEDAETVPTCPAFKEIGEKFGGFDLALIPIG
jgi:N-acyl-phosphatidylethanolamine-hydrolysing phospholipase D